MQVINPISIGVAGAGRMGKAIAAAVNAADDLRLASLWVRDKAAAADIDLAADVLVSTDIDRVVETADVLIDFSLPEATTKVIAAVIHHGTPLICGVSGLSDEQQALLDKAAATVSVVYDRNMSLGVTVLDRIVRQAAASLGLEFDAVVAEIHHVHKIDAPSGTAMKLGEAIADARGQRFADVASYTPDAESAMPVAGQIRFEVERRGEVPGEHSVTLSSATESLTLQHSVTTRQVFADGALRAARWVVGRAPGRYMMRDVLFD